MHRIKMEDRKCTCWSRVLYESLAVIIFISNINKSLCQDWGSFPTIGMCDISTSLNNNVNLADGTVDNRQFHTEECVCRVKRKVPARIQFQNIQFNCSEPNSWKLEFYVNNCLESSYTCDLETDTSQQYNIDYSSPTNEIYIKIVKASSDATETSYHLGVRADAFVVSTTNTAIIETECGIPLSSISSCDLPPGVSTTTTTTTVVPDNPSTTDVSSTASSSTTNSSVPGGPSGQKSNDESIFDKPEILGAIIGGGVLLLAVLIIVCAVATLRCRKNARKGLNDESQSEYSYARSIPGSINKEPVVVSHTAEKHREKQRRKREKKEERERKRKEKLEMEESKKHVYNNHIDPITYDNPAYAGTQNSMPDFIPPPAPPPQSNGHVPNTPVYAKSTKALKDKSNKHRKDKKSKEEMREIAVLDGGSVPYGYYDKVVESQFGFIDDEMYAGGGHY